jgi:C-terminal processing protease CtpA/Prc
VRAVDLAHAAAPEQGHDAVAADHGTGREHQPASYADARAYDFAIAELAARIPDGHVYVAGAKALTEIFGAGSPSFDVRVVEGQVVVTQVTDDARTEGLAVGDVIVTVNGEPIDARMVRLRKYIPAANETWGTARAAWDALLGEPGSKMTLTVRGGDDRVRELTTTRATTWSRSTRTGEKYRRIDDAIGYVDLDRLEVSEVDAMFAALERTSSIIFDMRGYPRGTAWSVAPRLNVRSARAAAQFFEPIVEPAGDDEAGLATVFFQTIPSTDKPLYRGKTVMLIDERTMSQAEHTGLFFEAANGTKFVGSQTAGSNGDITNLTLPGGISVTFSGHDVRHADGRQLQRVGLVPDVEVRPTIAGIRAGRDEVLDRAVAFVRTGS